MLWSHPLRPHIQYSVLFGLLISSTQQLTNILLLSIWIIYSVQKLLKYNLALPPKGHLYQANPVVPQQPCNYIQSMTASTFL